MLEVEGLGVRYGTTDAAAVEGVSFTVGPGEVLCVLGPSGSGKSSLLRAVAGLEVPVAGSVRWAGIDVTALPVHRRGFGFVFQDLALFPHRDVAGNIAFGLRMQRMPGSEARQRVEEVLTLVGLEGFGSRPVDSLSGGERQRVALARALAPRPRLLLLDEPFSSLDRVLRDELLAEVRMLLRGLDVAVVHVTHDQQEALGLATRVLILRDGRTVQAGAPTEVWRRPADAFVARFLGIANLLPAGAQAGVVSLPWGDLPRADADDVVVVIPPDALCAVRVGSGRPEGTVSDVHFRGDHFLATVDMDFGAKLEVPVAREVRSGDRLAVEVDGGLVSLVEPEQPQP